MKSPIYTDRCGYRRGPLSLYWEVSCDPISDDYTLEEASAADLWREWRRRYPGDVKQIHWFVQSDDGVFEAAPGSEMGSRGFVSFYAWPHYANGTLARWTDLPVVDKLWRPGRLDKGGFIQEHTGWKPSPLQSVMDAALLDRLTQ